MLCSLFLHYRSAQPPNPSRVITGLSSPAGAAMTRCILKKFPQRVCSNVKAKTPTRISGNLCCHRSNNSQTPRTTDQPVTWAKLALKVHAKFVKINQRRNTWQWQQQLGLKLKAWYTPGRETEQHLPFFVGSLILSALYSPVICYSFLFNLIKVKQINSPFFNLVTILR